MISARWNIYKDPIMVLARLESEIMADWRLPVYTAQRAAIVLNHAIWHLMNPNEPRPNDDPSAVEPRLFDSDYVEVPRASIPLNRRRR